MKWLTAITLLCLVFSVSCPELYAETEFLKPEDARRAIPNDNSPPARLHPGYIRPPLPPESDGTIRRVDVGTRKVVALTFDLCELATSTSGYDAEIMAFLRTQHIPATLFMGGKWMRTHRARSLEVLADPLFEIGNHTWSHGNFGIMSKTAMTEQINWTQAQFELLREELVATGHDVSHIPPNPALFRLPYGRCNDAALRLLGQAGMQVIQWDTLGEVAKNNTAPGLEKDVLRQVRPGSILLFHANRVPNGSASILQRTVQVLREQGYAFVTVSGLLTMGTPKKERQGYFSIPGDNLELDTRFGKDGTGQR